MFAIRIRYVFDTKGVLEIQSTAFDMQHAFSPLSTLKNSGKWFVTLVLFIWADVVQSIPILNQSPSEVDFIKKGGRGQNS